MERDVVALNAITERIIAAAYTVSNALGPGFLEKVYENALVHELGKAGVLVGDYVADLLVEREVLVELKSVRILDPIHLAQCLNYLKAPRLRVCLLLNFGTARVTVKRIVDHFRSNPNPHLRSSASIRG